MNVFTRVNETLFEQIERLEGVDPGNPDAMELEISRAKSIRELAGAVIDRFGKDVQSVSAGEGQARVNVVVMQAPTFFGWLSQFGTDVIIEKPESLKSAYVDFLSSIVSAYEE